MKFGIVVFPGSNCEADCYYVIDKVLGEPVEYVWHQEESVQGYDALILPGGFSYGDYLRTGAIARFSPVMNAVERFARAGGLVIGICNGFQILLEAGLLPGAMRRNKVLQFRCQPTNLLVEREDTPFSSLFRKGQVISVPINHGEGNYYADPATLAEMEANRQVVFRYSTPQGEATPQVNPNGSLNNIAGIVNRGGNVLGMMPHPERCSEEILGSSDGRLIFASMVNWLKGGSAVA